MILCSGNHKEIKNRLFDTNPVLSEGSILARAGPSLMGMSGLNLPPDPFRGLALDSPSIWQGGTMVVSCDQPGGPSSPFIHLYTMHHELLEPSKPIPFSLTWDGVLPPTRQPLRKALS